MKSFSGFFLNDFNYTVKFFFSPLSKFLAFISTICPNLFDGIHDRKQRSQYLASRLTIKDVRRMNHNNHWITYCINYNMSFPTLYQFPPHQIPILGPIRGFFSPFGYR